MEARGRAPYDRRNTYPAIDYSVNHRDRTCLISVYIFLGFSHPSDDDGPSGRPMGFRQIAHSVGAIARCMAWYGRDTPFDNAT